MSMPLAAAAEDFGTLLGASVEEFEPGWIESVRFEFEHGYLAVRVVADDDTVEVEAGPPDIESRGTVSHCESDDIFGALVGGTVRWIWLLTNHRGYRDGLQLEFTKDGVDVAVQFMAAASQLWPYKLNPLTPS